MIFDRPSTFATTVLAAALAAARVAAAPSVPVPLSACIEPSVATRLLAGESMRASSAGRSAAPSLAPRHGAAAGTGAALQAEAPDVIVEALFLWKKPRPVDPVAGALAVYNVLRAIGSLQGLEYWSASRGAMRLLYEYSSLVAGPDDRTPVRDTHLPSLPADAETLFARQKDLSFGDNIYRVSLSTGPGYTAWNSTNLTGMRYGIVPVASPGVVNVRLLVIDTDEGLIFYTVSSAKAAVLPGVRAKLESSFGNRAEAVYTWFSRELAKAWPAR
ncbi:MAG: hypothetical protein CVV51_04535 [Spirochaetae bacterium HGW-Spirochaetae-7]|jgi:hypothetical protein|nr:MAG: hypothetical protein CVV51_04535 [Spirochaetae bacterium HGW-Spirochaetae-7]